MSRNKALTLLALIIILMLTLFGIIDFVRIGINFALISKVFAVIYCLSVILYLNKSMKYGIILLGLILFIEIITRVILSKIDFRISHIFDFLLLIYMILNYKKVKNDYPK